MIGIVLRHTVQQPWLAVGAPHLRSGRSLPHRTKGERQHFADQPLLAFSFGRADKHKFVSVVAQQAQRPLVAVDDEQLADADLP